MKLRVLAAAAVAALAAPGMAHAAAQTLARPHLYRPNPVFTGIQLEYIKPLPTPTGGVAIVPPLSEAATRAAVLDQQRLAYRIRDDLGGFIPAPLGAHALSSGGHAIVGSTKFRAQIPLYQHHAGGKVNAFTFIGSGPGIGPGSVDNGKNPVAGLGPPAPVPPATSKPVPPANQGFSGSGQAGSNNGTGSGTGGTRTNGGTGTKTRPGAAGTGGRTATGSTTTRSRTTTTRPTTTRRTTTQATVSTTAPAPTTTTTVPTTTAPGGGGGGGGGGTGDCGGDGISIQSDPSNPNGCVIKLFNAKPGDEVHEVLTITNVTDSRYELALKVSGSQNQLWNDLEMGVWIDGTPTPSPLPQLLFWTTQYNNLTPLDPGESIQYRIQLYLPVEAGNVDQSLTAIINFNWKGH